MTHVAINAEGTRFYARVVRRGGVWVGEWGTCNRAEFVITWRTLRRPDRTEAAALDRATDYAKYIAAKI